MNASELRNYAVEAESNLICADSSSCSDPADCHRFAARWVTDANDKLDGGTVEVQTVRLGKVQAFRVTEAGKIRVFVAGGGTDLVDGNEVIPW